MKTSWTPNGNVNAGKKRVLVEYEDGAMLAAVERLLIEEGYAVTLCGGPTTLRRRQCPLVTKGHCPLAEGADVILHGLNPDRVELARVLQALEIRCPETPIVVEVPEPTIARHRDLLAGCHLLSMPMTRRTLLAAIETALGGATPTGTASGP